MPPHAVVDVTEDLLMYPAVQVYEAHVGAVVVVVVVAVQQSASKVALADAIPSLALSMTLLAPQLLQEYRVVMAARLRDPVWETPV